MRIKKLLSFLETIAPPTYQESYDNSGLIVGNSNETIKGVMICLDSIEEVVDEAIRQNCNLIIAHHPIIFKGLKKITGKNYIERIIIKAIKNNIAIYAIHTNLDNVYHNGVNGKIAEKLGLINTQILSPKKGLKKLQTLVPSNYSDLVRKALFAVGAGDVNGFEHLSFSNLGFVTENGHGQAQIKLEVLFPSFKEGIILKTLEEIHPNINVPYEISSLEVSTPDVGAGMIGDLEKPMASKSFLRFLKKSMEVNCIRHTKLIKDKISSVALCGGSGGFLLHHAIRQKADIFITADYKYHEFFDANDKIIIADIGHYESEHFTIDLLYEIITNKFSNFAVYCTKVNTNPIHYL